MQKNNYNTDFIERNTSTNSLEFLGGAGKVAPGVSYLNLRVDTVVVIAVCHFQTKLSNVDKWNDANTLWSRG